MCLNSSTYHVYTHAIKAADEILGDILQFILQQLVLLVSFVKTYLQLALCSISNIVCRITYNRIYKFLFINVYFKKLVQSQLIKSTALHVRN